MLKIISAAIKHPGSRSLAEFHEYWGNLHGPLFARTPALRRYVQHHSLPESYSGGTPTSTHDGASMFWYDDLSALRNPVSPVLSQAITPSDGGLYEHYVAKKRYGDPETMTLQETVRADDRQLFDRADAWPRDAQRATVVCEERIVVDGPTSPSMVKAIYTASRKPGLALDEFLQHWFEVHGQLGSRVPGLRRYVQNHVVRDAYGLRAMTHDGFSELWFDDLESLRQARESAAWAELSKDGQTLFTYPMSVVVAREKVIKELT
jgi:uncharacterized protein (TIGR02118 family)